MADEIRTENTTEPVVVTTEPVVTEQVAPTGDAEKGAIIGGVGGLVAGALAGAVAGPGGAVIGAVVGGVVGAAASGAAVAAVDRIDDDSKLSGLPDDMSIDPVTDRDPVVTDRNTIPPPPINSEAPVGVGVQEAIIMTEPTPSEMGSGEPAVPIVTEEVIVAEDVDDEDVIVERQVKAVKPPMGGDPYVG